MRIGIVNHLASAVTQLRHALQQRPTHELLWVAQSGEEALALCAKESPDLVLIDLVLPGMDGVEATRQIMLSTPCAILIVAESIGGARGPIFEAMGVGALDVIEMPAEGSPGAEQAQAPLLAKIDTIQRLVSDHRRRPSMVGPVQPLSGRRLLAIGASAGGPAALATLLQALPISFPAAIVIVQHVDAQFAAGMADWLGQQSPWPVRVAQEGDRPSAGLVLLAGSGDHLVLKGAEKLGYTSEPLACVYRPSVDVFFHSINQRWQGGALGVLLSGMGSDGALGLKAMRDKGHHTIAQDQGSSAVYGMPKAAAKLNAACDILPLTEIGPRLMKLVTRQPALSGGSI